MYFADLAEVVDRVRANVPDTSEIQVLLKDLNTGDTIDIDAISMDGDDNLVIEFDYEG